LRRRRSRRVCILAVDAHALFRTGGLVLVTLAVSFDAIGLLTTTALGRGVCAAVESELVAREQGFDTPAANSSKLLSRQIVAAFTATPGGTVGLFGVAFAVELETLALLAVTTFLLLLLLLLLLQLLQLLLFCWYCWVFVNGGKINCEVWERRH